MNGLNASEWAKARFGGYAGDFARHVTQAIHSAHDRAMAAHLAGELDSSDAYGTTLAVAQHEELNARSRHIDGVAMRKPSGIRSRFDLVVFGPTAVVLYPWRYAVDAKTSRVNAKLRKPLSDLRVNLLTLAPPSQDRQLSLLDEQIDLRESEELDSLESQIADRGRVVTIGYASNPSAGIIDIGWGDAELVDLEIGTVHWSHWEPLSGVELATSRVNLRPVPDAGITRPSAPTTPRFDNKPIEKLPLVARTPSAREPTVDAEQAPSGTGGSDS